MTWNIVSDSSCDLRMSAFESDLVRFETVPLRLQVGAREFLDNGFLFRLSLSGRLCPGL